MTSGVDGAVPRFRRQPGKGQSRDRGPAPSTLSWVDQVTRARAVAVRLLSTRERSAAELRAHLLRAGYSPEPIDEAIAGLQRAGLQDDRRFAEAYASSAGGLRGYSARRIQTDLRGKGVGPELASAAAALRPEDELERALDVARRKARTMSALPPEVAARRLMGLLARRGYPPGLSRDVVAQTLGPTSVDPYSDPDVR